MVAGAASGQRTWYCQGGKARLPSARIRFGSRAWRSWPIALVAESQDSGLYGSCPCGGNHFYITHPSAQPPGNEKRANWWLGSSGNKYVAVLDACTSCRLVTGLEIASRAYVPRHVCNSDGSPVNLFTDRSMSTSAHYENSTSVPREFCAKCGAKVLYRLDNRTRDVLDIGVGLLKAKVGASAKEWLEWNTEEVKFADDATDKKLPKSFLLGMKAWAQRKQWGHLLIMSVLRLKPKYLISRFWLSCGYVIRHLSQRGPASFD